MVHTEPIFYCKIAFLQEITKLITGIILYIILCVSIFILYSLVKAKNKSEI